MLFVMVEDGSEFERAPANADRLNIGLADG